MFWDIVPSVSSQIINDPRSLKEQLLDCLNDIEYILNEILEKVPGGRGKNLKERKTFGEFVPIYEKKIQELNNYLELVSEHQEREQHIKVLEKCVQERNNIIFNFADGLKKLELDLLEVTHEAKRKLKTLKKAESNKVNSETLIRLAHQISKSHSIVSPMDWLQGDPRRPFPIQNDFVCSALMRSQKEREENSNINSLSSISRNPNKNLFINNSSINFDYPSTSNGEGKPNPNQLLDDALSGTIGIADSGISSGGITIDLPPNFHSKRNADSGGGDEDVENIEEMSSDSSLSSEDDED